MGKVYPLKDDSLRELIERQRVFFVATAPLDADGHINVSPKGVDALKVIVRTASRIPFRAAQFGIPECCVTEDVTSGYVASRAVPCPGADERRRHERCVHFNATRRAALRGSISYSGGGPVSAEAFWRERGYTLPP
jgi:hypothetical protein